MKHSVAISAAIKSNGYCTLNCRSQNYLEKTWPISTTLPPPLFPRRKEEFTREKCTHLNVEKDLWGIWCAAGSSLTFPIETKAKFRNSLSEFQMERIRVFIGIKLFRRSNVRTMYVRWKLSGSSTDTSPVCCDAWLSARLCQPSTGHFERASNSYICSMVKSSEWTAPSVYEETSLLPLFLMISPIKRSFSSFSIHILDYFCSCTAGGLATFWISLRLLISQ